MENRPPASHLGDHTHTAQIVGLTAFFIPHEVLGRGDHRSASRWMWKNFKGKYEFQSRS